MHNSFAPVLIVALLPMLLAKGTSSHLAAAEYSVEFSQNGSGESSGTMSASEVGHWSPWRTRNYHSGVNLYNSTGGAVAAIWIKVKDPKRDKFFVSYNSGGDLFPIVWRRRDNTEALFQGAIALSANSVVWNRVNDTSGATATTGYIFEGSLYTDDQPNPDPKYWVQVSPAPPVQAEAGSAIWTDIKLKLPKGFTTVSCYIDDANESRLFFLSRNVCFIYVSSRKELRPILIREPYTNGANRLSINGDTLELWKDGEVVARAALNDDSTYGPPVGSH